MAKNTSFSIGEHFSKFVETQEGLGRYSSASDVVRAGLRLLEEQETRLAALIEGEQSCVSSRNVRDIWMAVKEKESNGPANG